MARNQKVMGSNPGLFPVSVFSVVRYYEGPLGGAAIWILVENGCLTVLLYRQTSLISSDLAKEQRRYSLNQTKQMQNPS